MECRAVQRLLDSCRPSGEDLSAPELSAAAAHLEHCPACVERFHSVQALDTRVAELMQSVATPAGLCDRIFDRLDRTARRARRRHFAVRLAGAAIAASALLAVIFAPWPKSPAPVVVEPRLVGELVLNADAVLDAMIAAGAIAPIDVPDAGGIASISGRELNLPRPISLPREFSFEGRISVARVMFAERPIAVFRFDHPALAGTNDTDLFVLPHRQILIPILDEGPIIVGTPTRNPTIVVWTEGDTTYVAVLKGWLPKEWERLPRWPHRRPIT